MDEFKLEYEADARRRRSVDAEESPEVDEGGELHILPVDENIPENAFTQRMKALACKQTEAEEVDTEEIEEGHARFQFSLADMFALTAVVAVGLAGARMFHGGQFAFFAGILATCGFVFILVNAPERRVARRIGWTLLVLYGTASFAAMIGVGR